MNRALMRRHNISKNETTGNTRVTEKEIISDKKMSYYESLKLSPIERYMKLGIFPWKMLVQVLLVVFTIIQCLLIINKMTYYTRAQERALYNIFIDDGDKLDEDYKRIIHLYSVEELKSHILRTINNYYRIHEFSINDIQHPQDNPSPIMEFSFIDNNIIRNKLSEENVLIPFEKGILERNFFYKIDNNTLGPFDHDQDSVKNFLNAVVNFKINYTLVSNYYTESSESLCTEWIIMQNFDFSSRSYFVCSVDFNSVLCGQRNTKSISYFEYYTSLSFWVHFIVLTLAILSLFLTWKSISKLLKLYMRVKLREKRKTLPEDKSSSDDSIYFNPLLDSLSSADESNKTKVENQENNTLININAEYNKLNTNMNKASIEEINQLEKRKKFKSKKEPKKHLQVLQLWSVLGLIGNLIQIFGAGLALSESSDVTMNKTILIGSGCLFACINLGKYFEYNKDYAIVYETLRRSFPVVIRFLVGVFPIFLGFLFFSISIFWRSDRFSTTSNGSITLFSIIQGDAVYNTFKDLTGIRFFIGQIFLYLFCIMFIIIVWNIFISIIEEAYVVTKLRNKTSWIYNYIKLEPKYVEIKIHSKPSLEMTRNYFANMKKTSEILKNKISKSLKSNEILKNKNKELSILTSSPSIGKNISLQSVKPPSFILSRREPRPWNINVESIPEKDEFLLPRHLSSKKFSNKEIQGENYKFPTPLPNINKEKQIETIFSDLEQRFEKLQKMIIDLSENKKTIPLLIRLRKDKIKKSILNRVNLIENKAEDLRRVWIGD